MAAEADAGADQGNAGSDSLDLKRLCVSKGEFRHVRFSDVGEGRMGWSDVFSSLGLSATELAVLLVFAVQRLQPNLQCFELSILSI
jgi:hypothetical protein